ncbi:hypothetical protein OIO90_004783 [Microbotryomycetes sp. JL221]|nr:hypothetical protein OIO90_004783 [Microbotryomycetes sp. JL221]
MTSTSGYSLWLSPSWDSSPFPALLDKLSSKHDTVPFKPHTTLVADSLTPQATLDEFVEMTKKGVQAWKIKKGASGGNGLNLTFYDVRQGDMFYQCVLAALVRDVDLVDLHLTLRRAYGTHDKPDAPSYFPHMSLVYGDLTREKKDDIIREMKDEGDFEELEDLTEEGGRVKIKDLTGYKVDEILVVKTSGPTTEWDVLARVPL